MLAAILPLVLLAAATFDFEMTAQDRKRTGLYKLTDKEKNALQDWIDAHYEKRSEPVQTDTNTTNATLQENLQSGRYIRLSDASLWEINPQDMPITQGWITPVEIVQSQSGDPNFPTKLTNSLTGSSVRARKVTKVPSSRPQTQQQPPQQT